LRHSVTYTAAIVTVLGTRRTSVYNGAHPGGQNEILADQICLDSDSNSACASVDLISMVSHNRR
jgi:hypothetical protein